MFNKSLEHAVKVGIVLGGVVGGGCKHGDDEVDGIVPFVVDGTPYYESGSRIISREVERIENSEQDSETRNSIRRDVGIRVVAVSVGDVGIGIDIIPDLFVDESSLDDDVFDARISPDIAMTRALDYCTLEGEHEEYFRVDGIESFWVYYCVEDDIQVRYEDGLLIVNEDGADFVAGMVLTVDRELIPRAYTTIELSEASQLGEEVVLLGAWLTVETSAGYCEMLNDGCRRCDVGLNSIASGCPPGGDYCRANTARILLCSDSHTRTAECVEAGGHDEDCSDDKTSVVFLLSYPELGDISQHMHRVYLTPLGGNVLFASDSDWLTISDNFGWVDTHSTLSQIHYSLESEPIEK